MEIAVHCHACRVGMKIRGEYVGKAKRCPKCGTLFVVPARDGDTLPPPAELAQRLQKSAQTQPATGIQPVEHPKTLDPHCRYVVLDGSRPIAAWQQGQGWQVSDGGRLVAAKRNPELLPKQGDFRLVELCLAEDGGEVRLVKIRIFRLANQYSVAKLASDEGAVLGTIVASSGLLRGQKQALLTALKNWFMRSVWADAQSIYDYLLNDDFTSSEVK